jgi:hypothetical protein
VGSGRLISGIAVSIPSWCHGFLPLVSVVCCQIELSATDRSLVQRNSTEYGGSECDLDASTLNIHRPTRAVGGGGGVRGGAVG